MGHCASSGLTPGKSAIPLPPDTRQDGHGIIHTHVCVCVCVCVCVSFDDQSCFLSHHHYPKQTQEVCAHSENILLSRSQKSSCKIVLRRLMMLLFQWHMSLTSQSTCDSVIRENRKPAFAFRKIRHQLKVRIMFNGSYQGAVVL